MTSRNRDERSKGIRYSGESCIVCGWNKINAKNEMLIEGAHVRPISSESKYDTAENIIALCPNHHTEYDAHNFYIDMKTKNIYFRNVKDEYNGINVSSKIKHIKPEYLSYNKYLYDKFSEKR